VPFEAVSTKPIALPCILTWVNYGHNSSLLAEFGKKRGSAFLGFPDPLPTCPAGLFFLVLSLAEVAIPNATVYKPHTDIDGLWVFDAYSAVLTLWAKQSYKLLHSEVVNRLTLEVFQHTLPFLATKRGVSFPRFGEEYPYKKHKKRVIPASCAWFLFVDYKRSLARLLLALWLGYALPLASRLRLARLALLTLQILPLPSSRLPPKRLSVAVARLAL